MKTITEQSNKHNELLAIELLKVAKSDVAASEILYENRLFSQSYFYFQQATEKATKALILFLEMSSAKETFNVRHNIFKLHKTHFFKAKEENEKALNIVKTLPFFETSGLIKSKEIKEQLNNSEELLSFFDSMKEFDLINIPTKDIHLFLEKIKSLDLKRNRIPADLEKWIEIFFMPFISEMESHDSILAKYMAKEMKAAFESEEIGDLIRGHFADVIESFVHIMYSYAVLYFSGYLTIQHSSISRYPDTNNPKRSPLRIYNKKLSVVKYQSLFLQHLKKAIIMIEKYI